jgi:hypothetical protein
MVTEDLQQRGRELRGAIDHTYKTLVDRNGLQQGLKGNDISPVVSKYIPLGTSFDDAEKILRAAGFTVDPRPGQNPPEDRPDKHDVVAYIVPYVQGFMSRTNVYISLRPKSPGNYTTIAKVNAGILVSLP